MDITLSESESKYYNDLFTLCDVEKIGKISKLKSDEFFRSATEIEEEILTEINQIAGVIPSFLYLTRTQFYSCLKLIGAYQAKILPLREEVLTSTTIQLPLPKFSWKLELEPPPEVVDPTTTISKPNHQTPNGILSSAAASSSAAAVGSISPDLIELSSSKESHHHHHHHHHHHLTVDRNVNSDLPSTDSEMEQTDNERDSRIRLGVNSMSSGKLGKSKRSGAGGGGSPTWSTTSDCDSPTPMNSRIESGEITSQSWQGLLCEEQRQLLGTEEESSDRHSSDEDDDDLDLEALYQITSEQKEYYLKQFRTVQPVVSGLLSGVVAKVFFEKSRIPVEELRHIWQLCDVTRDGALDVAEFTAAMHLVVLRRNNIPIPSVLPTCLQPHVLCKTLGLPQQQQPREAMVEADLLNLESDDNQNNHQMTQRANVVNKNEYQRMISSTYDDYRAPGSGTGKSTTTIINKSSTLPKNHFSSQHRGEGDGSAASNAANNNINNNNLNLNLHNNNNNNTKQMSSKNVITTSSTTTAAATANCSGSNSPQQTAVDGGNNNIDGINSNKEWTKFTESPTSNLSSPGPKPVNVTQAIVSDPSHVVHPVPLRVTPVGGTEVADEEALRTFRKADTLVYESGVIKAAQASILERIEGVSPKQHFNIKQPSSSSSSTSYGQHQRDSLPSDLRAIQRPHPKKPASKNIGQIPMPPLTSSSSSNEANQVTVASGGSSIVLSSKKEIPPLPPPRPHRHTRSSSLDLQRIKLSNNNASHDQEAMSSQPPELPPPRISDKSFKMPSVDTYVEPSSSTATVRSKKNEESFADFTQFPDSSSKQQKSAAATAASGEYVTTIRLENHPPVPQPRLTLTNTVIGPTTSSNGSQQRTSAFEVYRKPSRSRSSQSPPPLPQSSSSSSGQQNEGKIQDYEKQVHAISENLRQVKFPRNANDQNSQELLKYLKEQNSLLIRLCNDLSDELLSVQKKKEEIRGKLDNSQQQK